MGKLWVVLAVVACVLAGCGGGGHTARLGKQRQAPLPIAFEANQGQTRGDVAYIARGRGGTLALGRKNARLVTDHGTLELTPLNGRATTPRATTKLPGRVNYFVGSDQAKWKTGIPTYAGVKYAQVWPGVDLAFHGKQSTLEYDFDVAPHADATRLALQLQGASNVRLNAQGDALVTVGGRDVVIHRPHSTQGTTKIDSRFQTDGNVLRIALGAYDRSQPLLVDPAIEYASFLGGNGADTGNSVAVDSKGGIYVAGTTTGGYPTGSGVFQTTYGGGSSDFFVTKLNDTGTAVDYSTYLGGLQADTNPQIAVDSGGSVYLTGSTAGNYPVTGTARQTAFGGARDAVVSKLSSNGASLTYSTYLGGAEADDGRAIAVDGAGVAYVVGAAGGAFPTVSGAPQLTFGGGNADEFVTRVSADGTQFLSSTYIGGSNDEEADAVALDSANNIYVVGTANGANFPVTANSIGGGFNGGASDLTVAKYNATGTSVQYATYVGGPAADSGAGIAVDGAGNAFVAGTTSGAGFPFVTGAYQSRTGGGSDAVIAEVDPNGTSLLASTYLGGAGDESLTPGHALALGTTGEVYVVGDAGTNFPSSDTVPAADGDGFIAQLRSDLTQLRYSSVISGGGQHAASAVAMSPSGHPVLVGTTTNSTLTAAGTRHPQATFGGGTSDAYIASFDPSAATVPPGTAPSPSPAPATPTPTPAATATATPTPTPVQGKTFNLVPVSGRVTVKLPGAKTAVPLESVKTIPTGTLVDTTSGRAKLFAANVKQDADGTEFYDGLFQVKQPTKGNPVVDIVLKGDLSGCKKTHASKKKPKSRKVWGSGKGTFRTVGKGASAAVRGTQWLTSDTCTKTTVTVRKGIVLVTDKLTGATIFVKAGQHVDAPFSLATLRKIQKGGKKVGTLTAKAKKKLRQG